MQNLCFGAECTILGYRTCGKSFATNASNLLHSSQNDVWEHFGACRNTSARNSVQNMCFEAKCSILGNPTSKNFSLQTHPIYSIRPKMMFGSVSEHFATLLYENRCKTCVSWQKAQFQGTKLPKKGLLQTHPIYSNIPQTMFGSVSEHFATLLHENRCKTCVSGHNAQFRYLEIENKVSL